MIREKTPLQGDITNKPQENLHGVGQDQPELPSSGTIFASGVDSATVISKVHTHRAKPLKTPGMDEDDVTFPSVRLRVEKDILEQRRKQIQDAEQAGLLSRLTPVQQRVLRELYPPEGFFPSQNKTAKNTGLSREYIRQVDNQALGMVKKLLTGESFVKRTGRRGRDRQVIDQRLGSNPQEALKQMVQEGLNQREIAERLGCSLPLVSRRLNEWGIEHPRQRNKGGRKRDGKVEIALGENPKESLSKMLNEQKLTLGEVAKQLGCSYALVRLRAIEWGIPYSRWKRANREDQDVLAIPKPSLPEYQVNVEKSS